MAENVTTELESPAISGWRALVSILTEPAQTFRRLGARPPVLPAYLLQMLVGAVVFALTYKASLAMFDQAMTMSAAQPNAQPMPPGGLGIVRTVTMVVNAVVLVAGPWVIGLVLSLFALFLGQFQGGGVTFRSYFGMIGYARVPLVLSALLAGIYQVATGQMLNLSLSAFLPAEASPQLAGVLSTLNPFAIWYYALLATGFAALFGRPAKKGWTLPALLWVVNVLLAVATAGTASLFGQFQ